MPSHDALLGGHRVHRFVELFGFSFVHYVFANTLFILVSPLVAVNGLVICLWFFVFDFVEDGSVIESSKFHFFVKGLECSDVVESKFCHFRCRFLNLLNARREIAKLALLL